MLKHIALFGMVMIILTAPVLALDTTAPIFSNLAQDKDDAVAGEVVKAYALFKDDVMLDTAVFQIISDDGFEDVDTFGLMGNESWAVFKYTAQEVTENTTVLWRIIANDTSGNSKATNNMSFTILFIPSCPSTCNGIGQGECTDWSDCESGMQYRYCYSCGEETEFACSQALENRTCVAQEPSGPTSSEALAAIRDAQDAIAYAKDSGREVKEAEALADTAQIHYNNKEYELAISNAEDAEELAVEALAALEEQPEFPYLWALGVIVLAFAGMGIYYFYRNKEKIFVKHVKGEPKKMPEKKVCEICGEPIKYGYKCSECGKLVDFKHARTYKGKVYCTECLKRKGLV